MRTLQTAFRRVVASFIYGAFFVGAASLSAATYYVDSAGKDTNDGKTPATAWESVAKVGHTTFSPGDKILFKAGGVWTGQLAPRGNGSAAKAIVLSSYGDGVRPVLNGGGQIEGTIKLLNQAFWEIRGLEVTNHGAAQGQYVGIKVRNCSGQPLQHIVVADCVVHDVNGYASGFYGANAGISVVADMNNSTWNDVLIENNEVHEVDRVGIFVGPTWQVGTSADWMHEPKSAGIVIQNNAVWNLGGDGILNFMTRNALIQHNLVHSSGRRNYDEAVGPKNPTGYLGGASAGIWNVISEDTTIQFNEVYDFQNPHDGQGYDIDMGNNRTELQYNYSHDNDGGFLLIGESAGPARGNGAKVRFNISQNDGPQRGVVHIGGNGLPPGPDKLQFNNNTLYVPAWAAKNLPLFREYPPKFVTGAASIFNNIFYIAGTVRYPKSMPDVVFDSNVFHGNHPASEPADAHKLTTDPHLLAPGSGGIGIENVAGYQLQVGSPAIGSGRNQPGDALGGRDYWGNPVSLSAMPNRGAYNGSGVASVAPNWALNASVTASRSWEAGSWSRTRLVDGLRSSVVNSSGYSSMPDVLSDHSEWVVIDWGVRQSVGKVTIYPATFGNPPGQGFPRGFEIQTWDGNNWRTQIARTEFANPGTQPQVFKLSAAVVTDRIRFFCSNLNRVGRGYTLQLAEIEVTP